MKKTLTYISRAVLIAVFVLAPVANDFLLLPTASASVTETLPTVNVQLLVVGGGGSGGNGFAGGGGGAGGLVYSTAYPLKVGTYSVSIGAGGTGVSGGFNDGNFGGNSTFGTVTAKGGGAGAGNNDVGYAGGSGGGGSGDGTHTGGASNQTSPPNATGFGNTGGSGNGFYAGGGGGGAGAVGADGDGSGLIGGNGGSGNQYSISGSATFYSGGGGGTGTNGQGTGGQGGGGAGGASTGTNGTANTGGGGGGVYSSGNPSGNGGSGIVIVSYTTGSLTATCGGTQTTSGGNTICTFTSGGTFIVTALSGTSNMVTIGHSNTPVKTIFLTHNAGSLSSWTVPADWNNASNSIEVIGGGGSGGSTNVDNAFGDSGDGGGGGAYAKILDLSLTPGASVKYEVGAGGAIANNVGTGSSLVDVNGNNGGATWFNGTTAGGASVSADFGLGGPGAFEASGGAGGLASNSIGTIKFSGGSGGNVSNQNDSTGGGGAAGPSGAGNNGVSTSGNLQTTNGGSGDNSALGGGAAGIGATDTNGTSGGNGTEYTTAGSGGGGGAGSTVQAGTFNSGAGGNGGSYGAGGGGAYNTQGTGTTHGGAGGQGLIVITYLPTSPPTLQRGLVGYWTLDGNQTNWLTGITKDSSGNGQNGSLIGMSTTTSPTQGKVGQALNFTGTQYVDAGQIAAFNSATVASFCGWLDLPVTGDFVSLGADSIGANNRFSVQWDSSGGGGNNIYFTFGAGGSGQYASIPYSGRGWHYICNVFNGNLSGNARIAGYLDGLAQSLTVNQTPSSTLAPNSNMGDFLIGGDAVAGDSIGKIDDVRAFNIALTPQQVAQLYAAGAVNIAHSNPTPTTSTLNNGLIGYWTFDGPKINWSGPTALDSTSNANTGTLVGFSQTTSPVAGKIGQALQFNGSAYINAGNTTSLNIPTAGSVTMCAWVYDTTGSNGTDQSLMAKREDDLATQYAYGINFGTSAFQIYESGNVAQFSYLVPANTWVYICGEISPAPTALYVNGLLYGTQPSIGGVQQNSAAFLIGADRSNATTQQEFFNGSMDDVRVYNRALSYQEIKQLYLMGK